MDIDERLDRLTQSLEQHERIFAAFVTSFQQIGDNLRQTNENFNSMAERINQQTDESLLRLPEVERRSGYKRASIYSKVHEGTFPAPVDLGGRATAWRASDIDQWIASRASAEARKRPQPMRSDERATSAARNVPKPKRRGAA